MVNKQKQKKKQLKINKCPKYNQINKIELFFLIKMEAKMKIKIETENINKK